MPQFGWRPLLQCAVTLPKQENARLGRKVNFAPGRILLWVKSPWKCIYSIPAQQTGKHRSKFGWLPLSDVSTITKPNANTLTFAGVPQTRQPVSAVSGPTFTILWRHVKVILLFNKLYFRLSIHTFVAKIYLDKVVRWCADGQFLRPFCVLCFQRAVCSTFLSSGF